MTTYSRLHLNRRKPNYFVYLAWAAVIIASFYAGSNQHKSILEESQKTEQVLQRKIEESNDLTSEQVITSVSISQGLEDRVRILEQKLIDTEGKQILYEQEE